MYRVYHSGGCVSVLSCWVVFYSAHMRKTENMGIHGNGDKLSWQHGRNRSDHRGGFPRKWSGILGKIDRPWKGYLVVQEEEKSKSVMSPKRLNGRHCCRDKQLAWNTQLLTGGISNSKEGLPQGWILCSLSIDIVPPGNICSFASQVFQRDNFLNFPEIFLNLAWNSIPKLW